MSMDLPYGDVLKIIENYPENILIEPQQLKNNRWFAYVYYLKDGQKDKLAIYQDSDGTFEGYETKEITILEIEKALLNIAMAVENFKERNNIT